MTKIPNVNKQDLPTKADEILSKDSRNAIRYHSRERSHVNTIETSLGFRIFDILSRNKDRPGANEIYQSVRRQIPTISFGTVYRALKLLRGLRPYPGASFRQVPLPFRQQSLKPPAFLLLRMRRSFGYRQSDSDIHKEDQGERRFDARQGFPAGILW